jgi:hypothetical protein
LIGDASDPIAAVYRPRDYRLFRPSGRFNFTAAAPC